MNLARQLPNLHAYVVCSYIPTHVLKLKCTDFLANKFFWYAKGW